MQIPFSYTPSDDVPSAQRERQPTITSIRSFQENQHVLKYEVAIEETQFGKFNYLLFSFLFIGGLPTPFEISSISFVIPAAKCDLHLTHSKKGALNAAAYFGMFLSDFVWPYFCDTCGRQKVLVMAFFLDAIVVASSGLSQNFLQLFFSKLIGGFIINGALIALLSYAPEMLSEKHRPKARLVAGIVVSFTTLTVPVLALGMLRLKMKIDEPFVLRSWNIFLFACAVPSLLSALLFIFMPESPKYLIASGHSQKAVKVFKKIFACNTGKNEEKYPIKRMVEDKQDRYVFGIRGLAEAAKLTTGQFLFLCFPPYLRRFSLICAIQALNMFSVQAVRLWIPAIFQAISDYQHYHNGTNAKFCVMLKMIHHHPETCHFIYSTSVYVHVLITAAVTVSGYLLAGLLTKFIRARILLCVSSLLGGCVLILIYFVTNVASMIVVISCFMLCGTISLNVILVIVVNLFQTNLMSITFFFVMIFGKLGAVLGSLFFPFLLSIDCIPPFAFIGSSVILSSLLTILLPRDTIEN